MDPKTIDLLARVFDVGLASPELTWQFWRSDAQWPPDSTGQVFLARAINEIGVAKFGPAWTGEEVSDRFLPFLDHPSDLTGLGFAAQCARLLLIGHGQQHFESGTVLSFAEAERAVSLFREHEAHGRHAGAYRLHAVLKVTLAALADGRLESSTRGFRGGGFQTVPAEQWNMDDITGRFVMCLMRPEAPEDQYLVPPIVIKSLSENPSVKEVWPSYIFVSRETLNTVVASVEGVGIATSANVSIESDEPGSDESRYPKAVVRRWFEAFATAYPNDTSREFMRPTRKEMIAEGQDKFPGISDQRIRDLWVELAPQSWRDKGPRKKRFIATRE